MQPRKRLASETAEFPRWLLATQLALVGLILVLAFLSDASGNLAKPGYGSIALICAVVAAAALLFWLDRRRRQSAKRQRLH